MSISQQVHKISLIVDANTNQLRSVNEQFTKLEREIARLTGVSNVMAANFDAAQKKVQNSMKNTESVSTKTNETMVNGIVRHIRQVESLIVAFYGLKTAYDVTLGMGLEFNRIIENEQVGLALIVAGHLKNVDVMGNAVTATEKWTYAQQVAVKAMKDIRDVNRFTPHDLGQTTQIYKVLAGQILAYGGTLDQVKEATKNVSIVSKAMNVDFDQLLKTVDSLYSGQMRDSDLKRALQNAVGLDFNKIKDLAKTNTQEAVKYVNEMLRKGEIAAVTMGSTWDAITSNFKNAWMDLWGDLDRPLFEGMKVQLKDFTKYLIENKENIVQFVFNITNGVANALPAIENLAITYAAFNTVLKTTVFLSTVFKNMTAGAILARAGMIGVIGAMILMNDETTSLSSAIQVVSYYFNLGFATIKFGIAKLAEYTAKFYISFTNGAVKTANAFTKIYLGAFNEVAKAYPSLLNFLFSGTVVGQVNELIKATGGKDFLEPLTLKPVNIKAALLPTIDTGILSEFESFSKTSYQDMIDASVKPMVKKVKLQEDLNKAKLLGNKIDFDSKKQQEEDAANGGKKKDQQAAINKEVKDQQAAINKEVKEQISLYTALANLSIAKNELEAAKLGRLRYENEIYKDNLELAQAEVMEKEQALNMAKDLANQQGNSEEPSIRKKLIDLETQLVKSQKSMWDAVHKQQLDMANKFKSVFDSFFDNLMSGKINEAFSGMFKGILNTFLEPVKNTFSTAMSNLLSGGGLTGITDELSNLTTGNWIALGVSILGSLFSSNVSQAEIDAAKGRTEFSDDSINKLGQMFESVQYPMLQATHTMAKYLRNMDYNFQSVAQALTGRASSAGIDITGANFVPTQKVGFLGFSSKSISLVSTGLNFQMQSLEDVMNGLAVAVQGYTTSLVQKSSWFGLKKSSYLSTKYQDLPDSVLKDIAGAFQSGYEAILTAGVELGFNQEAIQRALSLAQINLGKIDFTGLSSEEVSNRFSQAVSDAFSGVVEGIDIFTGLISRYATASEGSLETLIRIATEYEQASFQFDLIGKSFISGALNIREQVLDIVRSTGNIDNFNDAMSSFMDNFYSDTEKAGFLQKSIATSFATLGLTAPKTNAEFRKLLETMDTSTEQGAYLYGQVLLLADGFNQMTKASENLGTAINDVIQKLSDAWTGEYSPLTMIQKTAYATEVARVARENGTSMDVVDTSYQALVTAAKSARTQEDYAKQFFDYVTALEKSVPDATNRDLLNELKSIRQAIQEQTNLQRYA